MTNNLKVKLPSKKLCASFCTDKKIHKKRRNTTTLKEKKSFKVKALSKVNHKKLSSSTKDIETSYLTIKTSHLKKNSRKSYRKNKVNFIHDKKFVFLLLKKLFYIWCILITIVFWVVLKSICKPFTKSQHIVKQAFNTS